MKKLLFTMLMLCTIIGAYAGNPMKVTNGNGKFLKEAATATVTFDWSQAQWNNEKPLTDQWGEDYQKLIEAGEKAFKEGFNENSKKVKIADGEVKYRFDVKITNIVEHLSSYCIYYYLQTSGSYACIQFFITKDGFISYAQPFSDEGLEDGILKSVVERLCP